MVVEVLGRDSGYLAAVSAVAGGAGATPVPEFETEPDELLDFMNRSYDKGRPRFTVVAAVDALADGETGTMVGIAGEEERRVPLQEVVDVKRPLDPRLYELAGVLATLPGWEVLRL